MSSPSSSKDEGLGREQRLRRSADYLCCYRRGRKRHGSLASLHYHPNEVQEARLGITASRKVGKAVIRHKLKRRIRNIFRRWPQRGELPSLDIVVHLKPTAGKSDFMTLRQEVEGLLARLVVFEKNLSHPQSAEPRRRRSRRKKS